MQLFYLKEITSSLWFLGPPCYQSLKDVKLSPVSRFSYFIVITGDFLWAGPCDTQSFMDRSSLMLGPYAETMGPFCQWLDGLG